jgi:DNA uptake protein ComE-like DNA-binding protein
MKEWLVAYFSFSRQERIGVIALVSLISLIWLLPRFFAPGKTLAPEIVARADSFLRVEKENTGSVAVTLKPSGYFDPNLLSQEEWVQLGVPAKAAATIGRYLEKGGRFRQPSDLRKIYSLRREDAERLMPYVRIKSREPINMQTKTYHRMNTTRYARPDPGGQQHFPFKAKDRSIDVNEADSAGFETLPLIGPRLASRIVKFRESCGGFYSIDQLSGVYGIHDTVFLRIRPLLKLARTEVRKLSVNRCDKDSLAMHPYITALEARALVSYREQHGPFRELADLEKVALLNREWILRIAPYLSFE